MFEFYKLCNEYEKLNSVDRGLLLAEKSVSVLSRLRQADMTEINAVETLAAFILGSIVSDGGVSEKDYLYIYPSLIKTFGSDFDFSAIKETFKLADDIKKEIARRTKDMMSIIAATDEKLRTDIISLCLLTTSVDGKISLKEKRYIRQLCRR